MMTLAKVTAALGASLEGSSRAFAAVSTDTREDLRDKLFIALRGERFDAHDFIAEAAAQGAAGAIVAADVPLAVAGFPLIRVADTRQALSTLAAFWRAHFAIPVIGVTGSNGKTTVKEMCAAILRAWLGEDAVLATQGNLNNDIGVPLMLLRLRAHHRAAVIEMGMNHPGEIAPLAAITRPGVAIVTNAQRAHLAGMGGLRPVAAEKGEIYRALPEEGVAVINADDPHADWWRANHGPARSVSFGLGDATDVGGTAAIKTFGSQVHLRSAEGEIDFELPIPGLHNVRNALGAAAACLAAGAPLAAVAQGLERFAGAGGRLQRRQAEGGAILLDDTYNANPDSVRAAIDVLTYAPGQKILVLGDMGEIGEMSAQYHDEIGGYAKSAGVDRLFALGEQSALAARNFGAGGEHFASCEELIDALRLALGSEVVVLVKGSRFMRMERVVNALIVPPAA
ncbi:MAG: UDP-N-acetylmuramoyl-tripeptide--D-alanyl-D-alanine ligase [Candidatus Dactylopiibacterium carminicum]|uniref:UDP-N-acetylmuramoyl-tripeptide--D-alanyl-D-alanine ligase n=1 Tax=Candidatus Dactylopiibacterium carminicum TaxID=857335 RepID=A0A272EQR4_9RHOO|nr:UDP-N-acetylmuramoyl-tripeptide--D-alanyl-D-alanine ligase [Candidatus Dactylopiibacterium carminicum]KAF7599300.1 UDP-N-acetylmuramoyl-tripeptide--D-alanyl-D-alanine ligase [Candidatus Dactylopiibacterium carminicum]PAS92457.1 MAG: UDP-N-acetylmuramoyl-tripeptide--D-alanyl-D-alanine ligase [Candidatus Dactylopiibacterium carminicum]PAS97200.1 MAG: UDP-N-acetylmuramoyl-tripeptide--D-alanyl-D-alanine ligase [Candidatus Dactylopiibacterium carminicum]PAS99304.1 MAG: UDP-N-acetylmuramoyl-tripep